MTTKEKSTILDALETAYRQYCKAQEKKYHDIIICQFRFHALELERLCCSLGLNKEMEITKEFCYKNA